MMVVRGEGEGVIAHARNAARALVCLWVEWSGYPRLSRAALEQAAEMLGGVHQPLGIACFVIDETAPDNALWDWLMSLQRPTPSWMAGGWGSLLWVQNGQVVQAVPRGDQITAGEIVARCQALWGGAHE